MKKLIILTILIALTSCVEPKPDSIAIRVQPLPEYFIYTNDGRAVAHIVEIDSCEYLILDNSTDMTRGIAHKGNCKYCEQRKHEN